MPLRWPRRQWNRSGGTPVSVREGLKAWPASQFEAAFVSAAHSEEDIGRTAAVIAEFFAQA